MTISFILVVLAVLALLFVTRLARVHIVETKAESAAEQMRPVDLLAFRNLTDPQEEEFLRAHLRPAEFRKLQRERMRVAVEYVSGAAHNAGVLLRMTEAAGLSGDPTTVASAEQLRQNATRLRLYALQATGRLYLAMLLPGASAYPANVAECYERMTRQVVMLGLPHPSARAISAAL